MPAGLTRMNPATFAFYTMLGAGFWSGILTLIGYFIGGNERLIHSYLHLLTIAIIGGAIVIFIVYWAWQRRIAQAEKRRDA